ncbi:MAG: biotin transporter BioY [Raoultibacter sp.]
MEAVVKKKGSSRTRSIAFCGLTIALFAVSAWITVPFGPVPFTMQVFVMIFALIALSPRECIASIAGYLIIGAIGLPVFSAMRGGIGVIFGPTGGFLWGYLMGAVVALLVMQVLLGKRQNAEALDGRSNNARHELMIYFIGAAVFLAVMYVCGWAQLMVVTGMSPWAAFLSAVGPFVIIDCIKTVVAVFTARAVKKALH